MTNSNGNSHSAAAKSPALRVIPLGGLHEIGKNTCVFEYGDDLMLVDAGLAFPSDGMHGVNVVLPDTSYLRENQKRIRGMIVTHGHEDHIGGIPHHLKNFNIPIIYGPRLALSMLDSVPSKIVWDSLRIGASRASAEDLPAPPPPDINVLTPPGLDSSRRWSYSI